MITEAPPKGNLLNAVQDAHRAQEIARVGTEFIECLHVDGDTFEIRVLNCPDRPGGKWRSTVAGWFNELSAARVAIEKLEAAAKPPAFYVTLNPTNPDLKSRGYNSLKPQKATTNDIDITRRRALLIDIDPVRPAGISSTDDEMRAALESGEHIRDYLTAHGWAVPLVGMSGNGGYLIFRIDLPNNEESTQLIKNCLNALSDKFSNDKVAVDTSTFNAARIVKILGTVARKGEDYPGSPRPHRTSWFTRPNGPLDSVTRSQLEALANEWARQSIKSTTQSPVSHDSDHASVKRCRAYMQTMPGAVAGNGGHVATIEAACTPFRFGITGKDAFNLLAEYNTRCEPPWNDRELQHKLTDAERKVRQASEFGCKLEGNKFDATKTELPKVTVRAGSRLTSYVNDLRTGNVPKLILQPNALRGIEIGYKLLIALGADAGTGKTAIALQIAFDALELDPGLRVVIAEADTDFETLLRRQLVRKTGICSEKIRFADLTAAEMQRITEASAELMIKLDRVSVLAELSLQFLLRLENEAPGLLIVDYLQLFAPSDVDARTGVGQVMRGLRYLATKGWAVLAISATTRRKPGDKLTKAHLRESSEIEFNCDSIYLMNDNGPHNDCDYVSQVTLNHAKNRHGPTRDIHLVFNKPRMEFTAMESPIDWPVKVKQKELQLVDSDPFSQEAPF